MDEALRRAWTTIVTPDDYEEHMARIGQAQAAADLMRWLIETAGLPVDARIAIVGAGTGQALDFLDASLFQPFRITFSDLNPRFLDRLKGRLSRLQLSAQVIKDDIENTALEPAPDLLFATLLLEHIDWRRGIEVIAGLRPSAMGFIIQENPPDMQSAITPGRTLPASVAEAAAQGRPVLIPRDQLVSALIARGYRQAAACSREVADGKRLIAILFRRKIES